MRTFPIAVVAAACFAVGTASLSQDSLHRQSRRVMGSLAEIQVYHSDSQVAAQAITAALDEMDRVDRLLTNYSPDSELSAMNRAAGKGGFKASPELYDFVKRCQSYFEETKGTFDPTVGPIVRAWGFFTPQPAMPSDDNAAAARARSGFDKLRLEDATRTVSYATDGLELDPGGIGKGYAADRAAAVLRQHGIASALVSAGGSTLYALGHPPDREGWNIAVRNPSAPATSLRYVVLSDSAISTSGVSEKFVMVGGRRYSHIIDPRSGQPAEGMCQVSVVSPTATDSDALTKAAFLLSREAVQALVRRRAGTHALRVEGLCAEAVVWTTPGLERVFRQDDGPARVAHAMR